MQGNIGADYRERTCSNPLDVVKALLHQIWNHNPFSLLTTNPWLQHERGQPRQAILPAQGVSVPQILITLLDPEHTQTCSSWDFKKQLLLAINSPDSGTPGVHGLEGSADAPEQPGCWMQSYHSPLCRWSVPACYDGYVVPFYTILNAARASYQLHKQGTFCVCVLITGSLEQQFLLNVCKTLGTFLHKQYFWQKATRWDISVLCTLFLTTQLYYPIYFCLSWKHARQDAQQQKPHGHARTRNCKVISIRKVRLLNI